MPTKATAPRYKFWGYSLWHADAALIITHELASEGHVKDSVIG